MVSVAWILTTIRWVWDSGRTRALRSSQSLSTTTVFHYLEITSLVRLFPSTRSQRLELRTKIEQNNQFLAEVTGRTLLERAKALLNGNGSLSEAALMLEAAIQKGESGEGGYDAWILLGEARNMDEREDMGIKALTEGVRRAKEAGANGVGMLVS